MTDEPFALEYSRRAIARPTRRQQRRASRGTADQDHRDRTLAVRQRARRRSRELQRTTQFFADASADVSRGAREQDDDAGGMQWNQLLEARADRRLRFERGALVGRRPRRRAV